jgi:c-di-GMP-binding flagellar brake protein YcgR
MLSKVLSVGDKVELTRVQAAQSDASMRKKVYVSQIYEVVDETRVKVGMPIENGHIVALAPNTRLDACFYTAKGLYHGRVVVVERMRENNIYVMVVELQYELKKFQRRQYYRLNCTMDLLHRPMEDEEQELFINKGIAPDDSNIVGFKNGIALDFSGGGIRFISQEKYNKEDLIVIRLKISYDDEYKIYSVVSRVISSIPAKNGRGNIEHRVEFVDLNSKIREEIIRYIFREERKQRQKSLDV